MASPAEQIIADVAARHRIFPAQITGRPFQARQYVRARKEVIRILRGPQFRWSYPRIGELLNRDHSTIMHLERSARWEAKEEWQARGAPVGERWWAEAAE